MQKNISCILVSFCVLFVCTVGLEASKGLSSTSLNHDVDRGQALVSQIPVEELLGPLAPVALSPFFGLACLSGSALLAEQGVLPANLFLTEHTVLGRTDVFVIFLVLSLLTSLPRLTKTGKLFTQMADQAETYAGIIAYAVLIFLAPSGDAGSSPEPVVVTAGMFSFPLEVLFMLVAGFNILVVTTVRAFFELLIWLSPLPLVDALFETMNKGFCLILAAVYAFNPWAAFLINILIFLVCLALFKWSRRRMGELKNKMLLPLWRKLFPGKDNNDPVEVKSNFR